MNIWQLLYLQCRHSNLSRVYSSARCCIDCGMRFDFHNYDVQPDERHTIEHYKLVDRSIRKINYRLLLFKRRKEMK